MKTRVTLTSYVALIILLFLPFFCLAQSSSDVFTTVSETPLYPGGDDAFRADIMSSLFYPNGETNNNLTGTVFTSFIVEKDGSISGIDSYTSLPSSFKTSAEEAIRNLQKFSVPAKHDGKIVRYKINVPIKFTPNTKRKVSNETLNSSSEVQTQASNTTYTINSSQDSVLMSVFNLGRQYNKSTSQYNIIDRHNYFNLWANPASTIGKPNFDKDKQMKLINDSKTELDLILMGLDSLESLASNLKTQMRGYSINPANWATHGLTIDDIYGKLKNAEEVYLYTYKDYSKWVDILELVKEDCGLNADEYLAFRRTFFTTDKKVSFFYKNLGCSKLDKKLEKYLKKGIIQRFSDNERVMFIEKLTGLDDRYFVLKKQLEDTEKTIKYIKNKYVSALGNSPESFTFLGPIKNNVPNGFGYLIAKDKKHILSAYWSNGVPSTVFEINTYHSSKDYWSGGVRYRIEDEKLGQSGFMVEIMPLNYKESGKSTYNIYIGNFKKSDKIYLSGYGVCFYENNDSKIINYYQGNWSEGKKNGNGTYFSQSTYSGSFVLNEFVNGTRTLPNGDKHLGDFSNWNLQGVGEIVFANGTRQKGYYENGNFMKSAEQYQRDLEEERLQQIKREEARIAEENRERLQREEELKKQEALKAKQRANPIAVSTFDFLDNKGLYVGKTVRLIAYYSLKNESSPSNKETYEDRDGQYWDVFCSCWRHKDGGYKSKEYKSSNYKTFELLGSSQKIDVFIPDSFFQNNVMKNSFRDGRLFIDLYVETANKLVLENIGRFE
jgi:hypothetical protein